ncbi:large ribosomal subunit protein bL34m [Cloeon dipterum]|uniref:large ribosomal subunit protein bL34m n=1 Tax=Cloeon dipterum TaxID=197152 RepID=UPI003220333A
MALPNLFSGLLCRASWAAPSVFGHFRPLLSGVPSANISTTSVLANIRCHFPRPSEIKRVRRHGWKKRMSTLAGRKIIMNRILKGRFVLSH